jgi:thiosulfate/3-mercaptopyruvate sulfurtransferase
LIQGETTVASNFARPTCIVETEWLAAQLGNPALRILDCTTHLVPPTKGGPYDVVAGSADFDNAHIPGALLVEMDRDVADRAHALHFMLPSAQLFASAMSRLGIGNETKVIAYSTANHWWATRMWWMLRVFGHNNAAVLNGGFQKWRKENRPVETGPARPVPEARFVARYHPELVADKAVVLAAIGDANTCTLNALRPEQHAGGGATNYGRPGHIKGSINIAAVNVVDENNVFKSADELRALFAPALESPRVITYCGGGIAASSATLLLHMLGHDNIQLYDASLSEWAPDPSLPMETSA